MPRQCKPCDTASNSPFRQQRFEPGDVIETIMGIRTQAFARAGAGENGDPETRAGVFRHMQIVVIIADDGHAVGRDTDRLTEAEDHAGLRLGAVTAVISRNEIDIVFETEADGRLADGVFVVAGGDTELVAASLQPRENP